MVKQGKKNYVISGADSSCNFVFEVKNNPRKSAGSLHPFMLKITVHFTWTALSESFNMDTGRWLGRDKNGATKNVQYLRPKKRRTSVNFMPIILSQWEHKNHRQ